MNLILVSNFNQHCTGTGKTGHPPRPINNSSNKWWIKSTRDLWLKISPISFNGGSTV